MNFFPEEVAILHICHCCVDNYQWQDKKERETGRKQQRERGGGQDSITKLNRKGWLSELEAFVTEY